MLMISMIMIIPAIPAHEQAIAEDTTEAPEAAGDFTHFVLAEEFTATWCVYCPSAADALADVYYNYSYEFYFVAMICDVNDKAADRMDDYPTATGYPTTEFDGGDEEVVGSQDDSSNYRQAVEDCGARDDTKISLEINVSYEGESTINVDARVRWDETGGILNPTFDGYLRVYIAEIESRYINYDGEPYHFGFLDYAFDETIELYPNQWWEESASWTGSEVTDTNGDDFGDIGFSNIAVIASFFNDEDSDTDNYALQTTAVVGPEVEIIGPDGETHVNDADETIMDEFSLYVEAETRYAGGEPVELVSVQYAVNDFDFTDMTKGTGHNYSAVLSPSDIGKGSHIITIKATDDKGLVTEKEFQVLFGAESEKADDGINVAMVGGVGFVGILLAALFVLKKGQGKPEEIEDPEEVIF